MTSSHRIGAIYPDDAWVDADVAAMTADFRSYLPADVEMETAGTPCPNWEASAKSAVWLAENGDIEEAARRLLRYAPSAIAYFCTTVSFIRGAGGDEDLCRRMTDRTGLPATTTSTAMVRALRTLGIQRVALASPYMPDVEAAFRAFLEAHGFSVVRSVALNLPDGHMIVPIPTIRDAAVRADSPDADAVFVGCTGQKLAQELDGLERQFGKPVLCANQVTAWDALRLAGHSAVVPDRGSLLALTRPAA